MNATIEKKGELLWVDQEAIDKTMISYEAWAKEAEYALDEAQKLLPKELEQEQKELLLNQGWSALEGLIRNAYGFPKATVEFALSSQGLDGSTAKAAFDLVPARHAAVGFKVTGESVIVSPETEQKVKDRHYHYVNNNMQSKALKTAKELCNTLNQAFSEGIIATVDRTRLRNALPKLIKLTSAPQAKQVFEPAARKIGQIKN
ncbi:MULTISPECIES: hypothetical protein [Flavobacteriaceae]|uniref:hypothetical protein n=1 Tax=Flavobacteriaceae TaxID=49546 RepID=UPI001490A99F|nr:MULTISPECIES: hypothetical protein [Allomuricauda]MDC6366931.1 hypothetical protein [Muricauda sp. AC10]